MPSENGHLTTSTYVVENRYGVFKLPLRIIRKNDITACYWKRFIRHNCSSEMVTRNPPVSNPILMYSHTHSCASQASHEWRGMG